VQPATRAGVSESGYCERRGRAPSARAARHAWLTGQIRAIHLAPSGTCGSRRVHAELTFGPGHQRWLWGGGDADAPAGIKGLPGDRRPRPGTRRPPRVTR
jgi:putative transposase